MLAKGRKVNILYVIEAKIKKKRCEYGDKRFFKLEH